MSGFSFVPANIKVAPGATVTFTNNDGVIHNAVFADNTISSTADFSSGAKTVVLPLTTGTYSYKCTHHAGMTGTVLVQ